MRSSATASRSGDELDLGTAQRRHHPPAAPSCAASIAATPKRVASTRSNAVGVPPRWMWPRTDGAGLEAGPLLDLALEPLADAAEADVAELVRLALGDLHRALRGHRALGDDDDREEPPRAWRRRISRQTSSMSNGCSGIRITSPPPASPEWSAIQPAWRPITSTTITRWCDSAVVCRRSIASVATWSGGVEAEGDVGGAEVVVDRLRHAERRRRPCSPCRRSAAPSVSSPPIAISPSRSQLAIVSRDRARARPRSLNGLVREVPRIVPPRGRIPRVDSIVSSSCRSPRAARASRRESRRSSCAVDVDALADDRRG